jgi:predicted DNA-binding transcriptional regulator AlpA
MTSLATFDDPLLSRLHELPAQQLLTAPQVSIVLQVSVRWLEDQRAKGSPPPWIEVGSRMVRYAVGPLRSWIDARISAAPASTYEASRQKADADAGLDEPILRGGRRKKPTQSSFGQFAALARASEEWPFILRAPYGRPVDFFEALGSDLSEDDVGAWLTLADYAHQLAQAAAHEAAEDASLEIAGTLHDAPTTSPKNDIRM